MQYQTVVPLPRGVQQVVIDTAAPVAVGPPSAAVQAGPAAPAPVADVSAESQQVARVLARLQEVGRELGQQQQNRLAELQQAAIELAVAVASRLVHERIDASDYPVENVVRRVLAQIEPARPVTVFLHPADLALLRHRLGSDQPLTDEGEVSVAADPALARGDCRAEAGELSVLAQLSAQIEGLRRELLHGAGSATRRTAPPTVHRLPDRRQTA